MNIELFIALVKERPVLYDLRNPRYKDRREKDEKWREIGTAMDLTSKYLLTRLRHILLNLKMADGRPRRQGIKYI